MPMPMLLPMPMPLAACLTATKAALVCLCAPPGTLGPKTETNQSFQLLPLSLPLIRSLPAYACMPVVQAIHRKEASIHVIIEFVEQDSGSNSLPVRSH